jgi:hypothetical protein
VCVEVIWTYDVAFEESDVEWASRWDVFLNMKGDKIRWVRWRCSSFALASTGGAEQKC